MDRSELIETLEKICLRKTRKLDKTLDIPVIEIITSIQEGLRPSRMVTQANLDDLWTTIRDSGPAATNFVLETAAELQFRSGYDSMQWRRLIESLASSLSLNPCHTPMDLGDVKTSIDDTIMQRVESEDTIVALLSHNKWAVVLALLAMASPIIRSEPIALPEEESVDNDLR